MFAVGPVFREAAFGSRRGRNGVAPRRDLLRGGRRPNGPFCPLDPLEGTLDETTLANPV